MMMFAVFCVLLALPWTTEAFAGTSSKRVFVGTPVSDYPKHLGASKIAMENSDTSHNSTWRAHIHQS